jgi:uncharacterized metal-binding protein YceD (DUF177 family)
LKIDRDYIIQFKGLKEGVHEFAFEIDKPFFEAFEYLAIPDGHVDVKVVFYKKTTFLDLQVFLIGEIQVQCDRCLEYFGLPVDYEGHMVIRFSETEKEPDEEVTWIHPDESEYDLSHYLYECLTLSIPIRKVHPDLPNGESGCNPEMIQKLNEYLIK